MFEFIVLKQNAESYTHLFWTLGVTAAVGLIAGALFGYLLGTALRRVWLPRYLQNSAVLAIMLAAFGVSNAIADESGLLTVTVMGIWLANMRDVDTSDILAFKEELSAILISALFIILAARLDIRALWNMGWPLLLLLLAVQFIARPLCIAVSTALFPALARSAAAVLDRPARHRRRGGQFAVRADAAAQRLSGRGPAGHRGVRHHHRHRGAAKPDQRHDGALAAGAAAKPRGVLIVGANSVARMLAQALIKLNVPVIVTDSSWEYYRRARMDGIPAYYGHAYSEHAENYLDLSNIARCWRCRPIATRTRWRSTTSAISSARITCLPSVRGAAERARRQRGKFAFPPA